MIGNPLHCGDETRSSRSFGYGLALSAADLGFADVLLVVERSEFGPCGVRLWATDRFGVR